MRKALNENKTVQLIVIIALLAGGVLIFMTSMKGSDPAATAGGEFPGSQTPPTSEVSVSASVNGESVGSTTVTVPQAGVPTSGVAAPSASVSPQALKPGPGLPADVVDAWQRGDAIVLLIAKDAAIDDRLVRDAVARISSHPNTAVFVTPASEISRYSRITQGVGVDRVPALVVIRPKRLSGSVPKATVEYGFRTAQGVEQAVDDALYSGRDNVPYHPG